jgi:hypothetical protein
VGAQVVAALQIAQHRLGAGRLEVAGLLSLADHAPAAVALAREQPQQAPTLPWPPITSTSMAGSLPSPPPSTDAMGIGCSTCRRQGSNANSADLDGCDFPGTLDTDGFAS